MFPISHKKSYFQINSNFLLEILKEHNLMKKVLIQLNSWIRTFF
ncbi:hypothetical protein BH20ACI4_BH20ACI4_09460 [soil metagenome]